MTNPLQQICRGRPGKFFSGGSIYPSKRGSTNDSRFQTALQLSERSAYARYYYFWSPGMPTLDSDNVKCEGVSNELRSLAITPLTVLHSNSIYFGNFLKNCWPYCHKFFTVARGHRGHRHVKILGKSDEEIFRGEGGKIFFDPLYLP